eukprot:23666-Rhodomonas_salina.2
MHNTALFVPFVPEELVSPLIPPGPAGCSVRGLSRQCSQASCSSQQVPHGACDVTRCGCDVTRDAAVT